MLTQHCSDMVNDCQTLSAILETNLIILTDRIEPLNDDLISYTFPDIRMLCKNIFIVRISQQIMQHGSKSPK